MEDLAIYIPIDRRHAMAKGVDLPERSVGAALFADISGFTSLTVLLLQEFGLKRGVEELPRLLAMVFDPLIEEIHNFGGSVISFAGDATTCWFDGDDGSRATAAALGIQAAMAQFDSLAISVDASVSLAVKVAIAVGPVRRYVVGDPDIQRLDVLAGETLERMADGEQLAARGEVLVAPEVVECLKTQLDIADIRSDPESGLAYAHVLGLKDPVDPVPWPPISIPLTDELVRPRLLPPVYDRLTGGGGEYLAEIRPSVALMVRFGGLDFDADPAAGAKLDSYVRWVQEVLSNYEGYLLDVNIGDKGCYLYGSFGSPTMHEDDPARAVAAALELQSPPETLQAIDAVQIGISQGRMRAGATGSRTRRTYSALGNEVNMAARLMGRAAAGDILVSQRIADAVADLYALEDLGRIKVKGRDDPIPVARILGRHDARMAADNRYPTPLVGRDAELAALEAILAEVEASHSGRIVRIQGIAGVGKSHFSAAFAAQASRLGWKVVRGACHSINQNLPYHPWQSIFRTLFDLPGGDEARQLEALEATVSSLNEDWLVRLPLLSPLVDLEIPDNETTAAFEPQLRQEALVTFAIDLLLARAATQPLLVLIEDAHWLDEASVALTLALSRVVGRGPLLLAVVHRPSPDPAAPFLPELETQPQHYHLDLNELSQDAVAAVIANRIDGPPAALLADLVIVQAHGNPFFVEEMTDALREAGHLAQQEDGSWTLSAALLDALRAANCLIDDPTGQPILNPEVPLSAADLGLPDSVEQVVLSRLDRLLEDQRLTLKVASVIGRVFEFRLLHRSHPLEDDADRLLAHLEVLEAREFARQQALRPELAHLFKHSITRDVAYETLLASQQRELHRIVAEAIEQISPDLIEQLAYHFVRADVPDKAVLYLGRSAQKAQREYANETALAYYAQALALEPRWEWRKGHIEVLHLLGRRDEERAGLEELAAMADAPPFEVNYLWGEYYESIADYPRAQAAIERAMNAAQTINDQLNEMRCLGQLGLIARRQGDYVAAADWYGQALADFDMQQVDTMAEGNAFGRLYNGLGIVHRQTGDFDQAQKNYEQTLKLSRKFVNLQLEAEGLNSLGVMFLYQRMLSKATVHFNAALDILRRIGHSAGIATTLMNLATTVRDSGEYDKAHVYYVEALETHQYLGNRWEEVNVWLSMGLFFRELGDYAQARKCLQRGQEITQEIGDEVGSAYLLGAIGLVEFESGSISESRQIFTNGLSIAERHNERHLVANYFKDLSMTNLRLGLISEALEQGNKSLRLRQELGVHFATTDNYAGLGEILLEQGDVVGALANAETAMSLLDESGGVGPDFPQQDYFTCFRIFEATGESERARNVLISAYSLVTDRAQKITNPRLRESYLHNVPTNRQIVETYKRVFGSEHRAT